MNIYNKNIYIKLYIHLFAKRIAMKFKGLFLFVFIFSVQFIFSQDLDLDVISIPDSLIKNATSVVRFDETSIDLVSHKELTYKVKRAITILNERGIENAQLIIPYDKSNQIKKLRAYAYDSKGIELKKITKKDFSDYSADGSSLFVDNRLKFYKYTPRKYPFTFYYEFEIKSSNTAFIPKWSPFGSYAQSIQKSTFNIHYPTSLSIQKSENNFDLFNITKKIDVTHLSYSLKNSIAIKHEDLSPSDTRILPSLKLATNKFRLEGVDGNANNWEEFGKWMYQNLLENRMNLPEKTKLTIKNLVKDTKDPIERARMVYEYVQSKTRYISVQVGIGGWMPMLASEVDELGYGDCKGLTNYTKALMDVAGVESYYTAVHADEPKTDMEKNVFSVQGNHVILNVPTENGDIWLECTSQSVPFAYQGTFTDDRDVLVITPNGGKIKHTNIYDFKNSTQHTKANYTLKSDGSIDGTVSISSSGIQYDNHYQLEKKSDREIKEYYKSYYWPHINDLYLKKYTFKNDKKNIVFHESIDIDGKNYVSLTENRMLFMPNAFNRVSTIPKRYRARKLPFEISRGFIDTDEFEISLPQEYHIESLPQNISIENKYGIYQFSIEKIDTHKLKYSRTFSLKKGIYSNSEYNDYRNFRKKVAKYDQIKLVLTKS